MKRKSSQKKKKKDEDRGDEAKTVPESEIMQQRSPPRKRSRTNITGEAGIPNVIHQGQKAPGVALSKSPREIVRSAPQPALLQGDGDKPDGPANLIRPRPAKLSEDVRSDSPVPLIRPRPARKLPDEESDDCVEIDQPPLTQSQKESDGRVNLIRTRPANLSEDEASDSPVPLIRPRPARKLSDEESDDCVEINQSPSLKASQKEADGSMKLTRSRPELRLEDEEFDVPVKLIRPRPAIILDDEESEVPVSLIRPRPPGRLKDDKSEDCLEVDQPPALTQLHKESDVVPPRPDKKLEEEEFSGPVKLIRPRPDAILEDEAFHDGVPLIRPRPAGKLEDDESDDCIEVDHSLPKTTGSIDHLSSGLLPAPLYSPRPLETTGFLYPLKGADAPAETSPLEENVRGRESMQAVSLSAITGPQCNETSHKIDVAPEREIGNQNVEQVITIKPAAKVLSKGMDAEGDSSTILGGDINRSGEGEVMAFSRDPSIGNVGYLVPKTPAEILSDHELQLVQQSAEIMLETPPSDDCERHLRRENPAFLANVIERFHNLNIMDEIQEHRWAAVFGRLKTQIHLLDLDGREDQSVNEAQSDFFTGSSLSAMSSLKLSDVIMLHPSGYLRNAEDELTPFQKWHLDLAREHGIVMGSVADIALLLSHRHEMPSRTPKDTPNMSNHEIQIFISEMARLRPWIEDDCQNYLLGCLTSAEAEIARWVGFLPGEEGFTKNIPFGISPLHSRLRKSVKRYFEGTTSDISLSMTIHNQLIDILETTYATLSDEDNY